MKNWNKKFDELWNFHFPHKTTDTEFARGAFKAFVENQIREIFNFFKQTGKQGGEARKGQNPDYSAIGKKGAAKRWKK
jgi:hypothetical protein